MVSKRRDLQVEKNGKPIVGPVRLTKIVRGLKDLPVCSGEDPFFFETFLSSVEQKIDFVGKDGTFRVSH
jgi:hypothetical protein